MVLPDLFKLMSLHSGDWNCVHMVHILLLYNSTHLYTVNSWRLYQCTSVLSGRLGAEAATAIRVSQLLTFSDDNYDFMNLYFCEMFVTKCKVKTINSILHLLNVCNLDGNLIFQ